MSFRPEGGIPEKFAGKPRSEGFLASLEMTWAACVIPTAGANDREPLIWR